MSWAQLYSSDVEFRQDDMYLKLLKLVDFSVIQTIKGGIYRLMVRTVCLKMHPLISLGCRIPKIIKSVDFSVLLTNRRG